MAPGGNNSQWTSVSGRYIQTNGTTSLPLHQLRPPWYTFVLNVKQKPQYYLIDSFQYACSLEGR